MTTLLAGLVTLGVVLPHRLPLERAAPAVAAATWCAALALRAVSVLYVAIYLALFLPHTELFAALTHWCWQAILPLVAARGGLDGTDVGGGAVVLPAAVLAASMTSAAWGLLRAARAVHAAVARAIIGGGPRGSVIVGGPDVLLAAAGVAHPRVLVSAGALVVLDDDELAAGLDHERGHIARRHRFVLVFAEVCRALARFLPGTRQAVRELRFQLERDADRWALARRHDPCALAGAICKASTTQIAPYTGVAALGGGDATRRLDELLARGAAPCRPRLGWCFLAGAIALSCLAFALAACVPVTAAAGAAQIGNPPHRHCAH